MVHQGGGERDELVAEPDWVICKWITIASTALCHVVEERHAVVDILHHLNTIHLGGIFPGFLLGSTLIFSVLRCCWYFSSQLLAWKETRPACLFLAQRAPPATARFLRFNFSARSSSFKGSSIAVPNGRRPWRRDRNPRRRGGRNWGCSGMGLWVTVTFCLWTWFFLTNYTTKVAPAPNGHHRPLQAEAEDQEDGEGSDIGDGEGSTHGETVAQDLGGGRRIGWGYNDRRDLSQRWWVPAEQFAEGWWRSKNQ